MRYDNGQGYFTIYTDQGVNVVLRGSAAEGKLRIDAKDPKGRHYIREMIEQAKQGGGFSDFLFPKPGLTEPLPKRYYTMEFAPYHWVIGTGIWLDQIDRRVAMREKALNMKEQVIRTVTGLALLEILFVLLAVIWLIQSKWRPKGCVNWATANSRWMCKPERKCRSFPGVMMNLGP